MEHGLSCQLCSAASHLKFNMKSYIQHLRLFHAYQIDFKIRCEIGGCQRSYTNCGTYINHIYSIHGECFTCKASHNQPQDDLIDEDGYNNSSDEDGEYGSIDIREGCDIPHHGEYGSIDIREGCNIPHHGSIDIWEGCDIPHKNDSHSDYSEETAQNFAARFLLGLKEKFKLTQVSLQGVIQGVTALNQRRIYSLKQEVCNVLILLLIMDILVC